MAAPVEAGDAAAAMAAESAEVPATPEDTSLPLSERLSLVLIALPVALRTALKHILRLSEPSKYVDLRTEITVAILRALTVPRRPFFSSSSHPSGRRSITETQNLLNRDAGIEGPIWVSKYTAPIPSPQDGKELREALVDVIKHLHEEDGSDTPLPDIKWPAAVPVEAEWTGHRAGVGRGAKLPAGQTEAERYKSLMADVTAPQPTTILYLHGGAMYLLDPASHRGACRALAKRTGGRCYSVRYRLAPQHPFPAQILDALVSYLTLLYPPPGAFHEPVSAAHIVLAGDSAGGNLCLALVRVLLDFQRRGVQIAWNGKRWAVPLPAGVAVNSPWIDVSNSSPSWQPPAPGSPSGSSHSSHRPDFDYLPPMAVPGADALDRPPCAAWPADPPRRFLYTETALVSHPLVTLLLGDPQGWRGAPPVYCCAGWEMLLDEIRFFVGERLRRGNPDSAVVFEQYEAMPHCFALVLTHLPGSKRCLDGWARFVRRAVEQPDSLRDPQSSSFTLVQAKTLKETPIDADELAPYTDAEIRAAIRERLANLDAQAAPAAKAAKTHAKL